MKKFMYIFGILALMSAGVACNNNDLTDEGDLLPPDAIRPALYGGAEVNNELTAFFEKYLSLYYTWHPEYLYFFGRDEESRCLLINSADELQALVSPSVELPPIDFDSYTLIVGQHVMGHGYHLVHQYITNESEEVKLSLYFKRGLTFNTADEAHYYWGLYPKLSQKSISVDVTLKRTE